MIPTGENEIENTIIITDGNYLNPSIESVVKINFDNENDIFVVREAIYDSKAGLHPLFDEIVRMYEEKVAFIEYSRRDSELLNEDSSEVRREKAFGREDYRSNPTKWNRAGSTGKDKSFSFNNNINNEEQAGDGLFLMPENRNKTECGAGWRYDAFVKRCVVYILTYIKKVKSGGIFMKLNVGTKIQNTLGT